MWPFDVPLEKKVMQKLRHLDDALARSFSKVRGDTGNLGQWIVYLNAKAEQQDAQIQAMGQEIGSLNEELAVMPKTPEDIKRVIDTHYSYDSMLNRIRAIEQRVEEILLRKPEEKQVQPLPTVPLPSEIDALRRKIEALEHKKLSLKEKIVQRVTKNSKEYLKGIILSYIRKYEQVSALQLKEMVVDDQQLCSKSSFYRLMEEIEQEHEIGVVREGKEKHYFLKALRKQGS